MLLFRKLLVFLLLLFVFTQLSIPFILPSTAIYRERVFYDVVKDNVYGMETTIKTIKNIIKKEKIENYIVLIGDSVGYSSPCPPENSIGHYMNSISRKENSNVRVFNLSIPSNMFGDVYTIIKLLHKHGISTQNLIIDFCYWEFVAKNPTFWFKHYLKELDNASYDKMLEESHIKKDSIWSDVKTELKHITETNISLLEYRSFISYKIKAKSNKLLGEEPPYVQPWYKKPQLAEAMKKPENKWYFTDQKFILDQRNPQIYFINKIIELQKGKNTLFFFAAINDKLVETSTSKPGFLDNLKNIDHYFADKSIKYINFNKKIDYNLFSDHVHLVPDGYELVAESLWKEINS